MESDLQAQGNIVEGVRWGELASKLHMRYDATEYKKNTVRVLGCTTLLWGSRTWVEGVFP